MFLSATPILYLCSSSALLVARLQAGAGHLFADAARFEEVAFQRANLLVQQVVGLVDEVNCNIRHHFGGTGLVLAYGINWITRLLRGGNTGIGR